MIQKQRLNNRILSLVLALVMVFSMLPMTSFTAFAADATTEKNITLGATHIKGAQASNVYFGTYKQSSDGSGGYNVDPIKWRVLSNTDGKLFLLSDQNLDVFRYHTIQEGVTWETSTMRSWLNGYGSSSNKQGVDYTGDNFIGSAFSSTEKGVIADTTVVNDDNPSNGTEGGSNTTDKVFLLSIAEVQNTVYGFTNNTRTATNTAYVAGGGKIETGNMYGVGEADYWWLRSPGYSANYAAMVGVSGSVYVNGNFVNNSFQAVRPAFNINLSSVLFTSAATGGKADGFNTVGDYSGADWKLTLLDESRNTFEATLDSISGNTVTISYSGAKTGSNEYISAIIKNGDTVKYYGRLGLATENGTAMVALPDDFNAANGDVLCIFNEQYNGDYKTDYASELIEIGYKITFDANGGECATASLHTLDGKLTSLPTPTRENYVFDGWHTAATGGDKVDIDKVYTADTTIYAQWLGDIKKTTITIEPENETYKGSAYTLAVSVTFNDSKLSEGTDYTVSWDKDGFTNADTYTATIEGKGNFTGKKTATFTIAPADISSATVTLEPTSGEYKGDTYTPAVSVTFNDSELSEGTDYTVSWDKDGFTNVDTYTATIEGKGNFTGKVTKAFTINAATLTDIKVEQVGTLTYNGGNELTPTVSASAVAVNSQPVVFTYSTEKDGTYGAMPTFTNAGTYTVYYKVSAPNHSDASGNFTVKVYKATVTEPTIVSKVYSGSAQTANITDTDLYIVTQNTGGENTDEYEVVLTLKDSANYRWKTTENAAVTLTFEITKATNEWKTEPTISGWTYGETASTPNYSAKFGTVSIQYSGTANDGTVWNSETAPAKAGNYTATFNVEGNDNYTALTKDVPFTIAKANYNMINAKWNYTEAFKYDGLEKTVEVNGLSDGVTVSGYTENKATNVGNYTAKVTLSYDSNNYNTPVVADLNWSIKNDWTPTEYITSTSNSNGWLNDTFVITAADGYKLSTTNTADSDWEDTLRYTEEAADGSVTFYLKNETDGTISLAKTVTYKIDTTPAGGTVEFAERKSWQDFVNTITFGLFYKNEVTVKSEAADNLSGIESIEYFASDKAMTLDEIKAVVDWKPMPTNGVGVTIEDAKQFVYFVRITDKAGNVTYLSTDGAEYDTAAPVIDGVHNGVTYYTTQKVTVTDRNLDTVTLNGETVIDKNLDTVMLNSEDVTDIITLEGDKETTYTIVATDKAGNSTTFTVTMKLTESVGAPLDGIIEDNVTSDDKETIQDVIDQIDALLADEELTEDEKAVLEEIKEEAEMLIRKIRTVNGAADTENTEKVEDVTAETVTVENKNDLENAKADLEKALEENAGNYTEDEKKAIEDEIKRIDDALTVIENVEATEDKINNLPENITKDDTDDVDAAKKAYEDLSDHEKTLIDPVVKAKLDDAVKAAEEANKLADINSPATGDTTNLWLWFALLFISGGTLITLTVYDRKKRSVNSKSS